MRRPSAAPEVVGHGQQRVADRRPPLPVRRLDGAAHRLLVQRADRAPQLGVAAGLLARGLGHLGAVHAQPERRAGRQPVEQRADRLLGRVQARAAVARVLVHRLRASSTISARLRVSAVWPERRRRGERACDEQREREQARPRHHRGQVTRRRRCRGPAARAGRVISCPMSVVASVGNDHRDDQQHPEVLRRGLPARLRARTTSARKAGTDADTRVNLRPPRGRRQGPQDPSWHGPKGPRTRRTRRREASGSRCCRGLRARCLDVVCAAAGAVGAGDLLDEADRLGLDRRRRCRSWRRRR